MVPLLCWKKKEAYEKDAIYFVWALDEKRNTVTKDKSQFYQFYSPLFRWWPIYGEKKTHSVLIKTIHLLWLLEKDKWEDF